MARKELHHILRDPRNLGIILLIPVIQLLLLGYAATTDVQEIRTGVGSTSSSPSGWRFPTRKTGCAPACPPTPRCAAPCRVAAGRVTAIFPPGLVEED